MNTPFQLALPFSMKDAMSIDRASKILGVDQKVVYRLMDDRLIDFMRRGQRGVILIRYTSMVEYCDDLRKTYSIPDRRPKLSHSIFRHRDEDLPPFPLVENVSVDEVSDLLQIEKSQTINLANRGDIEAYQLRKNSPWRFYRPSVEKYIAEINARYSVRRSVDESFLISHRSTSSR